MKLHVYGHAFETLHVCPNNRDGESNIKVSTSQYSVGVAKLSVERGFHCECTIGDGLLSVRMSAIQGF